jgi:single-strand DNA-binding protein
MTSLNEVRLIGYLGADPAHRVTAKGLDVANLRLATTEVWKDKETGEKQEATEWHRVVLFGRQAEIACQYLKKGSQVWVGGKLHTRQWEENGTKHYLTEVVGDGIKMLDRLPAAASAEKPEKPEKSKPKAKVDADVSDADFIEAYTAAEEEGDI